MQQQPLQVLSAALQATQLHDLLKCLKNVQQMCSSSSGSRQSHAFPSHHNALVQSAQTGALGVPSLAASHSMANHAFHNKTGAQIATAGDPKQGGGVALSGVMVGDPISNEPQTLLPGGLRLAAHVCMVPAFCLLGTPPWTSLAEFLSHEQNQQQPQRQRLMPVVFKDTSSNVTQPLPARNKSLQSSSASGPASGSFGLRYGVFTDVCGPTTARALHFDECADPLPPAAVQATVAYWDDVLGCVRHQNVIATDVWLMGANFSSANGSSSATGSTSKAVAAALASETVAADMLFRSIYVPCAPQRLYIGCALMHLPLLVLAALSGDPDLLQAAACADPLASVADRWLRHPTASRVLRQSLSLSLAAPEAVGTNKAVVAATLKERLLETACRATCKLLKALVQGWSPKEAAHSLALPVDRCKLLQVGHSALRMLP